MSDDTKITFEYVKNAINSGDEKQLELVIADFIRFLKEDRPEKWAKLMESGITEEHLIAQTREHMHDPLTKNQVKKFEDELKFQKEHQ